MIFRGDCLDLLKTLPTESVHACVTDPPYGLGMTAWDVLPSSDVFREILRVLKPGAFCLVMAATRKYHVMASIVEDAGFEILDCMAWVYSGGFPKTSLSNGCSPRLKPAMELIVVARKKFTGSLKKNLEKHGCGAMRVDANRTAEGRWPANFVHDGSPKVVGSFPHTTGRNPKGMRVNNKSIGASATKHVLGGQLMEIPGKPGYKDSGSAARYFYSAKVSPSERDSSAHPTMKPLALMRHLVSLVTQPGGTCLDPYAGSGTTGVACLLEGVDFIGCEINDAYHATAVARMSSVTYGNKS